MKPTLFISPGVYAVIHGARKMAPCVSLNGRRVDGADRMALLMQAGT